MGANVSKKIITGIPYASKEILKKLKFSTLEDEIIRGNVRLINLNPMGEKSGSEPDYILGIVEKDLPGDNDRAAIGEQFEIIELELNLKNAQSVLKVANLHKLPIKDPITAKCTYFW